MIITCSQTIRDGEDVILLLPDELGIGPDTSVTLEKIGDSVLLELIEPANTPVADLPAQ